MKINPLKFIFLLIGFCAHSQTIQRYVSEIAPIINSNNVTYLGETHSVDLHKKFLPDLVEYIVETSTISVFATEAVLAERQGVLNKYLTDNQAAIGSKLEKKYFSEIGKGLGWFQISYTWNLMRKLRKLKLKHGENFKYVE